MASVLAPPNPIHIAVYNTLNIVGFLANFSITLTAYFSRRIHRSRNWYLAMMTWTWWNIPYLLLMLGGHQLDVKNVPVAPRALCTIQAALIYSGPPTVAFANLGVIGHIASLLIETLYEKTGLSNKVSRLLFYIPLICYVTMFFISLSVAIDDLSRVTRNPTGAYCGIDASLPYQVSAISALIAIGLGLLVEVFTFSLLWKHRAWLKKMRTSSNPIPVSLFIRGACFSAGSIISSSFAAKGLGSSETFTNPVVVLMLAGVSIFAALAYGTQRDIFNVWMFWKQPSPSMHHLPNKEAASSV